MASRFKRDGIGRTWSGVPDQYVRELMDGSVGLSLNVCFGREGLNGVYRRNGVRSLYQSIQCIASV